MHRVKHYLRRFVAKVDLLLLPTIFALLAIIAVYFYPLQIQEKREKIYAEIGQQHQETSVTNALPILAAKGQ